MMNPNETIKTDVTEMQEDFVTMDLSEIVLDLESVKDNLFMIRHSLGNEERVNPDIMDSAMFVLERALERACQDLLAIPYKPNRKRLSDKASV